MSSKISSTLRLFLGVSCVGWLNAFYTLWHRLKLNVQGLDAPSFCNFNAQFNCDAVAFSRYGEFLGIPTAGWGLLFYSLLFVLALRALFQSSDRKENETTKSVGLVFALSALSLVPTIGFALISIFLMHTLCLMCLIAYLCNLALALIAFKVFRESRANLKSASRALREIPASLWLFFGVLAVAQLFMHKIFESILSEGRGVTEEVAAIYEQKHFTAPTREIQLNNRPSKGPADAKVTIVEYSDYQCPYCAREALTTPQIIKQYEGQVRVVFKNYPLDPSCNPKMKSSGHAFACIAAKHGHCIFKLKGNDAFFAYKSEIFLKQKDLSTTLVQETALKSGATADELAACVADYSTQQALLEDIEEGSANGVEGTPTLFLNNKIFEAASVPKIFSRVLKRYMQGN